MRKRAKERERDRQTEEKKAQCPSTSLHYVIGVGSAERKTLALKRRIVRYQFEVKIEEKEAEETTCTFGWRPIEDQSKTNQRPTENQMLSVLGVVSRE